MYHITIKRVAAALNDVAAWIGDDQVLASAAINALMIPVTEDLPPDQWTVWIWRDGAEEPEKGYRAGGNWISMETGMPVIVQDVTHWMPMLMPEQKEKGEQ